jgi:hypothetical protein
LLNTRHRVQQQAGSQSLLTIKQIVLFVLRPIMVCHTARLQYGCSKKILRIRFCRAGARNVLKLIVDLISSPHVGLLVRKPARVTQ